MLSVVDGVDKNVNIGETTELLHLRVNLERNRERLDTYQVCLFMMSNRCREINMIVNLKPNSTLTYLGKT